MKPFSRATFLLILVCQLFLIISTNFGFVHASSEASSTMQSLPEFTVRFVAYPYDVPEKTTTTVDPFTGEETITSFPSFHVENKSIEVIVNNNLNASYYNLRFKGHFEKEWTYYPSNPDSINGYNHYDAYSVSYNATNSSHTILSLPDFFIQSIPTGGEVDIQVQALFGDYKAVPYEHIIPLPAPTYDFYFEGTTTNWSDTQTLTIENPKIVPEFPSWVLLPLFLGSAFVMVIFKRKNGFGVIK